MEITPVFEIHILLATNEIHHYNNIIIMALVLRCVCTDSEVLTNAGE